MQQGLASCVGHIRIHLHLQRSQILHLHLHGHRHQGHCLQKSTLGQQIHRLFDYHKNHSLCACSYHNKPSHHHGHRVYHHRGHRVQSGHHVLHGRRGHRVHLRPIEYVLLCEMAMQIHSHLHFQHV